MVKSPKAGLLFINTDTHARPVVAMKRHTKAVTGLLGHFNCANVYKQKQCSPDGLTLNKHLLKWAVLKTHSKSSNTHIS